MILLLYRISLEAEVFGVNGVYNYTISLAKYCGLLCLWDHLQQENLKGPLILAVVTSSNNEWSD